MQTYQHFLKSRLTYISKLNNIHLLNFFTYYLLTGHCVLLSLSQVCNNTSSTAVSSLFYHDNYILLLYRGLLNNMDFPHMEYSVFI